MFNIAQKRTNIKLVHLKYLYEITAIPKYTKEEYLQKLLKRKNAHLQKNVKLIKIIYYHIDEDKMLEWNEENICITLKISKNMLYFYKHKILKELRLQYFNWKAIEKQELDGSKPDLKDKMFFDVKKAQRMYELGMKREAKSLFLKLEKNACASTKMSILQKSSLHKIYMYLCNFYYSEKNSRKFNFFFKKLKRINCYMLNNQFVKSDKKLISELNIEMYYCLAYKFFFKAKALKEYSKTIELIILTYEESKKIKDYRLMVTCLWNLADFYLDLNNYNKAHKYIVKGMFIAKKNKLHEKYFAFKISLLVIHYMTGKKNISESIREMLTLYNNREFQIENPSSIFQCLVLSSCYSDNNLFHKILNEYNSKKIINDGFKSAFRTLYVSKFSYYLNQMKNFKYEKDDKTGKKYLCLDSINYQYSLKLDKTIDELLTHFNRIDIIHFKKEIFLTILETEFWKGKEIDLEKTKYVTKQIEWLNKTRGKILDFSESVFENLKFCISLVENSKYLHKNELLKGHIHTFKELTEKLFNNYNDNILSAYTLFSFAAEQTGYKELRNIVKNLYWKLEKKYPDLFDGIKKEIEDRKNPKTDIDLDSPGSQTIVAA